MAATLLRKVIEASFSHFGLMRAYRAERHRTTACGWVIGIMCAAPLTSVPEFWTSSSRARRAKVVSAGRGSERIATDSQLANVVLWT
jgi:hypothetical protein